MLNKRRPADYDASMTGGRRPWEEELETIDRVMRDISGVTDPEKLVEIYFNGVGEFFPSDDYLAISRRNLEPPLYRITRASRFTEYHNPWKHPERLPVLSGGLLGDIAYANKPVLIEDLPTQLSKDDPGFSYLDGYAGLIASPQYEDGQGMNISMSLIPPGVEFDHSIIPMLHWQAGLFGRGTHNLVLKNQLAGALQSLQRELNTVGEIQRSLLPHELPAIPGFDLAAYYQTSARAGGDYYDFFPLADGGWGIFIADVAGHGTPAAVLMAITHAIAHAQPGTHTPPDTLLNYLNTRLATAYTRDGTFVTAFYAVLDPQTRTLTYARAGHNAPRLVRGDRVIALNGTGAIPMGIAPDVCYPLATVQLEPGDLLLLYTDGITEAMAPTKSSGIRDLFTVQRLDEVLLRCQGSAADCLQLVRDAVAGFTGNGPLTDDRTLLGLRVSS